MGITDAIKGRMSTLLKKIEEEKTQIQREFSKDFEEESSYFLTKPWAKAYYVPGSEDYPGILDYLNNRLMDDYGIQFQQTIQFGEGFHWTHCDLDGVNISIYRYAGVCVHPAHGTFISLSILQDDGVIYRRHLQLPNHPASFYNGPFVEGSFECMYWLLSKHLKELLMYMRSEQNLEPDLDPSKIEESTGYMEKLREGLGKYFRFNVPYYYEQERRLAYLSPKKIRKFRNPMELRLHMVHTTKNAQFYGRYTADRYGYYGASRTFDFLRRERPEIFHSKFAHDFMIGFDPPVRDEGTASRIQISLYERMVKIDLPKDPSWLDLDFEENRLMLEKLVDYCSAMAFDLVYSKKEGSRQKRRTNQGFVTASVDGPLESSSDNSKKVRKKNKKKKKKRK